MEVDVTDVEFDLSLTTRRPALTYIHESLDQKPPNSLSTLTWANTSSAGVGLTWGFKPTNSNRLIWLQHSFVLLEVHPSEPRSREAVQPIAR